MGDYSLIGHNAMLHGCHVGKACLIGIGCVVLDNAEIGDGAMITAGCMIRGGQKIPARAFVYSKKGELIVVEGKARPVQTVIGSLEYVELAARHQEKRWEPFSGEEIEVFRKKAANIVQNMQI